LQEIVDKQWILSNESNKRDVGKTFEVLIEGESKKVIKIGWVEIVKVK
jgi:tRNA-2-methylthio-N6-dimethylallyladenosine synthase